MREVEFDYSVLDEGKRVRVIVRTQSIKTRIKRTAEDIIAIGQDLLAVKEELDHGQFQDWLRAEFDLSYDTALNLMQVAKKFGNQLETKNGKFPFLAISVLYERASPKMPAQVVEKVLSGSLPATLDAIRAEKKRADEEMQARLEVERQLQELRVSVATLQHQLEERPQVAPKTVENPETEATLAQLQEKYAQKEEQLRIKTERVAVLSAELEKHAHRDEQETYRQQVRYQFRQACDAFHQVINRGMACMVTPLDAASAFEADDWARLADVENTLKRALEALSRLRESVGSQFVEGSVEH